MKKKIDGRINNGGARENSGPKSRESKGLEPLITISLRVEQSVIDAVRIKHKTLANALRYSVKNKIPKV